MRRFKPNDRGRSGIVFSVILSIALGAFIVASVSRFLGDDFGMLVITLHFAPQLAVGGMALVLVALFTRRFLVAAGAAALVVAHAMPITPYLHTGLSAGAVEAPCPNPQKVRLLALNLRYDHADIAAVVKLIEAERPDVVLLTEVSPRHRAALQKLRARLPHQIGPTGLGLFELLLMSRLPIRSHRISYPYNNKRRLAAPALRRDLPVLKARLCAPGGRCFTLVGLHAPPPIRPVRRWNREQLRVAAKLASRGDGRVVVTGDLNDTPWSGTFRRLLADGGLRDSALGHSFRATWRSRNPLFGLPIDHVLIGSGVTARTRRVGPDIGSDHFPVIADLAMCHGRSLGRN